MISSYDIIRRPIMTEKSLSGVQRKVYTFEVMRGATKTDVKKAVEEVFKVKVVKINTVSVKRKPKRLGVHSGYTTAWKKAIVTLSDDSKPIEFFEGMV